VGQHNTLELMNKIHYYLSPPFVYAVSMCIVFGGLLSWVGIFFLILTFYEMKNSNCYIAVSDNKFVTSILGLMGVLGLVWSIFVVWWRINSYITLNGDLGALILRNDFFEMYEGILGINLIGCLLSGAYVIHRSAQTLIQSVQANRSS
jgi:hypothetical protein